ncbi:hypothetical protein AB0G35_13600 [Streptomyces sp. NPDC021749]|uniref:hypothetical protein n=1 Tax=Streptomyces sp. NPDC021749 TaxID=3154905 RepID=UPI0033DAA62C
MPTALVFFSSLGAGVPDRGPTAARMAGPGHVIKELPVVAVRHVERSGSSNRSASEADYTVRLPAPDGGRGVPATFRAEVPRGVRAPGDTLFVAYAPERPEWGAVGAVRRADVEAQLVGRTLSDGSTLTSAVLWTVAAAAMVGTGTAITGPPRRSRRVDESWVALRATANGLPEHTQNEVDSAVENEAENEAEDKAGSEGRTKARTTETRTTEARTTETRTTKTRTIETRATKTRTKTAAGSAPRPTA